MHSRTLSLIALLCLIAALPAGAAAQGEEEPQNMGDFFAGLLSADWNVYAQSGLGSGRRALRRLRPLVGLLRSGCGRPRRSGPVGPDRSERIERQDRGRRRL